MIWFLVLLLSLALLLVCVCLCQVLAYMGRRYNKDGSFRVRFAPLSATREKVQFILPFQKLENLPEDYERIEDPIGNLLLRVTTLTHENLYGAMNLSTNSYFSRVYFFEKCDHDDIEILKAALSKALGAFPVLCGRFQNGSVVLPASCLLGDTHNSTSTTSSTKKGDIETLGEEEEEEEQYQYETSSTGSLSSTDNMDHTNESNHILNKNKPQTTSVNYGVPFHVYHIQDEAESPNPNQPLSPRDTAKYSVLDEPVHVMQGKAPLVNVCLYTNPNGSATLSIATCHAVMDAVSVSHWEQLWSQECQKLALQQTTQLHQPITNVPPVNRHEIPGPFEDMQEYRDTQIEFFGHVFDDGPTIKGTTLQKFNQWWMIQLILPIIRFFDDLIYVWGFHGDLDRNSIAIPAKQIKRLKQELTPPKPDWIASQDTIVAVLVQQVLQVLQDKNQYKKKKLRLVFWRDVRSHIGLVSNHAYGLGIIQYPIDIYNPHEKTLAELALIIRQGLQDMKNDNKAMRFWRLTTTVWAERQWAFVHFLLFGLADMGRCDAHLMINNSMFPLPDFGCSLGLAKSITSSAGPTMLLPQNDGGCRLFIEKELTNSLTQQKIDAAFSMPDLNSVV